MSLAPAAAPLGRRDFLIRPGGSLRGRLRMPGDKSISHRALLLGAVAQGRTRIRGFLESADCVATLNALIALGVKIEHAAAGCVTVVGTGVQGLHAPKQVLDCGNSGTSMRLLSGVLAGRLFVTTLDGDASLRRRPMRRIIEPLARMGARITGDQDHAPLVIHGQQPLKPLRYAMPVASAQVKSAILLAGLQAEGETWLREPAVSRDHTERMLVVFGCECLHADGWLGIRGGTPLYGADIAVPGDLSSAAFFLAGAAMTPGAELLLENIGVNPARTGIIMLLKQMGAEIHLQNEQRLGAEPVADIAIRSTGLHGIPIPADIVPLTIDDLPALLVAAACAEGVTTLHGAAELRVKESDRLQAMAAGLRVLGVPVELFDDGLQITGVEYFQGGEINSFGDHRIAMAFAMAAVRSTQPIHIHDCRNVETSFPGFAETAGAAGLGIDVEEVM